MSPAMPGDIKSDESSENRYTPVAQILHWLTALLIFCIVPIAWHMIVMQRSDPAREYWYYTHEALGVTILALSLARLGWRWFNPPLPGVLNTIERSMAAASHILLYVILIAMPLSGYLYISAGGHSLHYFGLFTVPPLVPESRSIYEVSRKMHAVGQWAVYAMILLHVFATVWHVAVRRDGILNRMLPKQTGSQ